MGEMKKIAHKKSKGNEEVEDLGKVVTSKGMFNNEGEEYSTKFGE